MPEFIGRPNLPEELAQMAAKLRAMVGQELGQGIAGLGKGIGEGLGKKRDMAAAEEARRLGENRAEEARRLAAFRSAIAGMAQQGQLSPQIGTGQLDMGALLPRLQSAMGIASGIGQPPPTIPLGGMTTRDLSDLMAGRPGPAYTINPPAESASLSASKARITVTKELAEKYNLPSEFVGKGISSNTLLNKTFLGGKGDKGDKDLRAKAMQYAKTDADFLEALDNGDIETANAVLEIYLKILRGGGSPDAETGKGSKPGAGKSLPGLTIE